MKTSARGVTLIEVLIAVSLLSILSVGLLMALRVGLNALDKVNLKVTANRRAVAVQQILRSEIGGFMPVAAGCPVGPDQPLRKFPFFDGRSQSMRFVSSYSLEQAARGEPRVIEFQVIPGDQGRGVRLVVNEFLYTGPETLGEVCIGMGPDPATGKMVARFAPIRVGPGSFVLADKLAYCRFSYRRSLPPPMLERWDVNWSSDNWPTAVHIDMAMLDPDPSRVPLVNATVPIRVNRQFNVPYTD